MKALLIIVVAASSAFARPAPPASYGEAGPLSQSAPTAGAPTPPPNYVYEPEDRRDPFVSLANRGAESASGSARTRPEGVNGVLVDEVVVRGIMQSRGGRVAMIGSTNGRTYTVRPGDRLLDGRVQAITPEAVVLLQEVNDPLSLAKEREVRKYIRGGDVR